MARGDDGERVLHLGDRAKRVARAVQKERGCPQLTKMLRAELVRLARRVERIGEQQKHFRNGRIFRRQNCGLACAVRVARENQRTRRDLARGFHGALEAFAIALRRAPLRRPCGALLTIGEIAAQHVKTGAGEGFGDGNQ